MNQSFKRDYDILWQGKWVKIISPKDMPYEMVSELHGTGNAIVCYPLVEKDDKIFLGVRKEHCPPYLMKDKEDRLWYTVITGMIDEDDNSAEEAMLRELREEAGIIANDYEILYHKSNCPNTKVSDIRNDFFVIKITDFEIEKAKGDGTKNEELSKTVWIPFENVKTLLEKDNVDWFIISGYFLIKLILSKE